MFESVQFKSKFTVAATVAGILVVPIAFSQSPQAGPKSAPAVVQPASHPLARRQPDRFAGRAGRYYALVWGIDTIGVKQVEAGEMIRFSYRVLDPQKAKMLNDKKVEPSLIDEQAHVRLVVPTLEKVGQLRQSAVPEAGRVYWMLFSNKGRYVKRGDRVNIVIGTFRADGLVVD